jgi:transposase-like protein
MAPLPKGHLQPPKALEPGRVLLVRWIEAQRANPPPMGFQVVALARAIGVTRTTLNAWRRGDQKPVTEHRARIACITKNAVPAKSWKVEES